ncbi:MAG: hypothetical protein D6761_10330 [Candidatus Dadabacteria bacterium]|nr:MAG: hypothetical protein D6761_10330 [Candidatus Dadabacteria bacterium]
MQWQQLLKGLQRQGRRVAFVLLACCALLAGKMLANGVDIAVWKHMPAAPAPDVQPVKVERKAPPPMSSYALIEQRNLFAVDVSRVVAPAQPETAPVEVTDIPEKLKVSPLPAEVLGTLGGPDDVAIALIRDKRNKQVDVYWVGDKLFDQATILKIRRGEVVILRNGQTEVLQLYEGSAKAGEDKGPIRRARPRKPASRTDDKVRPAASGGDVELQIEELSPNNYVIDREQFSDLMGNLGPLLTQARVVPNFERGRINGYKIFAIKKGSVFEQIGLRNGDIIQAINGVSVDTPEKALQLFQQLKSETEFNLELQRGGSPLAYSYQLR